MSDYIQQHEQETFATSDGPLNKSFLGLRNLVPSGTEPVAFMFTNQYTRMSWPDNKEPMDLRGAVRDRSHAKMFLDRFTPGIRVEGVVDASRQDIEDRIEQIAHSCPPLLVVYFQGHSEGDSGPLRYITGDRNEDGSLEGLTIKKLVKMFSKLSVYTMSTVITDFCGSGNIYRLRFRLVVSSDGKYFEWYETNEWRDDNKANQKYRIASPMLHVAASLEWQSAYETEKRGGYLTNSLAAAELEALPRFLLHLRQGVNNHLQIAKAHPRRPLNKDATQYPQIYCTCKLPLDDPEIFSKMSLGTAKPFYSNFN